MMTSGYRLFDTAIGRCGVAWNERGVAAVELPAKREADMRARLRRHVPTAQGDESPPPEIQQAIDGIIALLRGEATDLTAIRLDLDGLPAFDRRVYKIAREIPPGGTLGYGEIAARLGDPTASRDVGQALGHNPFPIIVPCHRVLAAGGKLGGFSAYGGAATKRRLLAIEGAAPNGMRGLFDAEEIAGLRLRP